MTHCVLYNAIIIQTDEFCDFFSDPRPDDLQVDLAHVYLRKERRNLCGKLRRKLESFEEL